MKEPYARAAVAAVSALTLLVARAEASVAPRWADVQMATFASVIVTGRVIDIRAGRDPRVHAIYTYVTLDVDRVLKGPIVERQIVVKQLGGVLAARGLAVAGQATFEVGADVLLFLAVRPRDRTLYTEALWQGKFTIDAADDRVIASRRDHGTLGRTRWRLDTVAALAHASGEARGDAPVIETRPWEREAAGPSYALLGPFRYDFSPAIDVQANGYPQLASRGIPEIVAAASRWNSAGGSFAFRAGSLDGTARCYLEELFNSRVTISFNDPCGEMADNSGTLAIGGSYFDNSTTTGTTVNGQYFFRATEGFIVSNNDALASMLLVSPNCFFDLHLHELGHVLGLGHSTDPNAIMYPTARNTCMIAPHDLGVDDIEGLQFIYPPLTDMPPSAAPDKVQVTVNGRESVVVSFTAVLADVLAAAASSAATSYRIDFSTAPKSPPFGSIVSSSTTVVVAVPPDSSGHFYVRVAAVNAAGAGPASAPVAFCVPPPTPIGLSGSVFNGLATASWNAAPGATWPVGFRAFARVIAVGACAQSVPTLPVLVQ